MSAAFYEFLAQNKGELFITEDEKEARELEAIAVFKGYKAFVLSDFRAKVGDDLRSYKEELDLLCKNLSAFYQEKSKKLLISPYHTILHNLPSPSMLEPIFFNKSDETCVNELSNTLLNSGYERVDIVQSPCEYSLRGDVLDIYPLNEDEPFRLLFFGDLCESIRKFDPLTQKSYPEELKSIQIVPFLAKLSNKEYEELENLTKNAKFDNIINDISSVGLWFLKGLIDPLDFDFYCIKELFSDELDLTRLKERVLPPAKDFKSLEYNFNKDIFTLHKNKKITIIASSKALVKDFDFSFKFFKSNIVLNLLSKDELIISLNKEAPRVKKRRSKLLVDELVKGDYIVHEDYGVAKFNGLEQVLVAGALQDFVSLRYQNDDKLLLPVDKLYLIDKFIAVNASIPSLDKLGKSTFIKMKERLKQKLFIIAANILALAAKRALIKAPFIPFDEPLMQRYLSLAGFTYTIDQEKICKEIVKDFQSTRIMDRLVSGDVGFGKTEIATYASLLCLNAGLNILFFVPTTLLSSQHFKNISKRLEPFGVEVLRLDRFTSTKEKKSILEKLACKQGARLVIGTHALLNVKCANLGLIIIDEEHKFGVKQKEKLKELSANSHLLSMSATPIPRSLNQALSQIKSYSRLSTPPKERLDVRTIFKEYNQALIKEAILRELRRGGQVFFIHNHIASIKKMKEELLRLIPTLKILVLHSKIDSKETELAMQDFENAKYELMLCTSIVESGIDLANANTIIINNANKFGIADLHQLRGRVGRSHIQGFCYLCIKDKKELSKEALKRLLALESSSFLGAGEQLAYHDLEIRGGGNLLGVDQSGHIEQIGYSLYLKMLESELNKQTKKQEENDGVDIKLNVNAFLNKELIAEDRLRLELYRRLSRAKSSFEINELEAEINDRFGECDRYTAQFLDLLRIKVLARGRYKLVSNYKANISFTNLQGEKSVIKASSSDDDDVLACVLQYLRKGEKNSSD